MSGSKRVRFGDPNFEATLLKWYEEDEEETSDFEDRALDPDFAILSDHESIDEQSADDNHVNIQQKNESEDSDTDMDSDGERPAFYGRNRLKWCKQAPNKQVRTRAENIIIHLPGLKGPARLHSDEPNPIQIWKLLFTDKLLDEMYNNPSLQKGLKVDIGRVLGERLHQLPQPYQSGKDVAFFHQKRTEKLPMRIDLFMFNDIYNFVWGLNKKTVFVIIDVYEHSFGIRLFWGRKVECGPKIVGCLTIRGGSWLDDLVLLQNVPLADLGDASKSLTSYVVAAHGVFDRLVPLELPLTKIRAWESDQDISKANDTVIPFGGKLEGHVTNLTPGKAYKLRVLAYSNGGDGRMSSPAKEFQMELKCSKIVCAICSYPLMLGNCRIVGKKGISTLITQSKRVEDKKWLDWEKKGKLDCHEKCRLSYSNLCGKFLKKDKNVTHYLAKLVELVNDDSTDRRTVADHNKKRYGEEVECSIMGEKDILVCFKSHHVFNVSEDPSTFTEGQIQLILLQASNIMHREIHSKQFVSDKYPPSNQFVRDISSDYPLHFSFIIEHFLLIADEEEDKKAKSVKRDMISQCILLFIQPRTFLSTLHLSSGTLILGKTGSHPD
ncbi:unnamed protein product [Acanthoscelides obtectus]|uniref:Fibronectin type-III domain-containing protein n=1 Tax=Acanthoscelides obtectus TaxID=200917 RepID=A0A9P0PD45_ACAOB|nr:unnamed protein product [Acanthoscelides obtectus]CAK1655966.1 Contactin [Acanthoscelides obtectus]